MNKRSVAAATLGCKVNYYETEAMLKLFAEKGYEIVDFSAKADVYIINTCTVTNLGDKKSRQMIRRAVKANSEAVIAAVGCYVQAEPESVAQIEGVDVLLGTKDKNRIVEIVEGAEHANISRFGAAEDFESLSIDRMGDRQRAFLKIQDGCDRFCAYCVVPYVRGPVRSRRLGDIVKEAETLAKNGYKEIVLSGIHVSSYGRGFEIGLIDAIESVSRVNGIERLRLSSLEPTTITPDFVERISRITKICDHFHLSLQSGCEKTLRSMDRRYTPAEYETAVKMLKAAFPDVSVTTDVIAGFPGESEKDFWESYEFCKNAGLSRMHVFPFSAKKRTKAFGMQGQVSAHDKAQRVKELLELSEVLYAGFVNNFIGKQKPVLFEGKIGNTNSYAGRTTNYIAVAETFDADVSGMILPFLISGKILKFE